MSARNQAKYDRMQARSNYPREWQTQVFTAPAASPLYCCYATFCCYCASFQQRKQLLYGDMSRYLCCAGSFPCAGRMGEQKCPDFCLATEVLLCLPASISSTRYALQDELRIMNTPFDNCVIGTMIAAQYLACVCSIAACLSGSDEVRFLQGSVWHFFRPRRLSNRKRPRNAPQKNNRSTSSPSSWTASPTSSGAPSAAAS
jgi:hypothetical protein